MKSKEIVIRIVDWKLKAKAFSGIWALGSEVFSRKDAFIQLLEAARRFGNGIEINVVDDVLSTELKIPARAMEIAERVEFHSLDETMILKNKYGSNQERTTNENHTCAG